MCSIPIQCLSVLSSRPFCVTDDVELEQQLLAMYSLRIFGTICHHDEESTADLSTMLIRQHSNFYKVQGFLFKRFTVFSYYLAFIANIAFAKIR
ncbi:hypothetical protein CHS0354_028108 [Potamilus streckersoni]|uniref:Uncharacterized protein n=1 Tax=Potamilus streckersoni TaxID=2493646 RepID=A0AAE0TI00_9BIVA|nr:hypothetical protein CHS0354_028108 [Potamilus streckersoni]